LDDTWIAKGLHYLVILLLYLLKMASFCLRVSKLALRAHLAQPMGPSAFRLMSTYPAYQHILVDKCGEKSNVGLITLNRPKALNALCNDLMTEVGQAIESFEFDDSIGAIILTGSERAFAAGADIKEMLPNTFSQCVGTNFLSHWDRVAQCKKPVIAAVNGYALGGGCELAMMCDIIVAGENARFGQPEITIGTIPGAGGTQRLIRSIGKSKAMEMCLTGNQITAQEAEKLGLVSHVVPVKELVPSALKIAEKISSHSKLIVRMCKECVNQAYELTLQQGLQVEKRGFHATFATNDRKEGMSAFAEKRKPSFTDS